MGISDLKDKVGSFLKFTSYVFKPYLELKYNPKKDPTLVDRLHSFLVWIATWVVVSVVYIGFVYLFVFKDEAGHAGKFTDFFEKAPNVIIQSFLTSASVAPVFNLLFLVVLYYAIISYAEKEYLQAVHVHTKLSGLMKVITLGQFDSTGRISEQDESQVIQARKNVLATLSNAEKEAIFILAPSGFDFFGKGSPLGKKDEPDSSKKKDGWFKKVVKKIKDDPARYDNGFLLNIISQRTRNVRIVLLNPAGEAVQSRANDYLSNLSHKPIEKPQDYIDGIDLVIKNLKLIYQNKLNRNIELKLVDKMPDWKMVIVEGEAWVQPIIPGTRSDHTPVYGFKKSESSMYYSYFNIFDEVWHNSSSIKVDLSK